MTLLHAILYLGTSLLCTGGICLLLVIIWKEWEEGGMPLGFRLLMTCVFGVVMLLLSFVAKGSMEKAVNFFGQ